MKASAARSPSTASARAPGSSASAWRARPTSPMPAGRSRTTKRRRARRSAATPIEFRVGTDALAVVVSSENDFVTDVTMEQLALIFSTAETWADVDPSWPAEPILRFSPGTDSGTFDYFVEARDRQGRGAAAGGQEPAVERGRQRAGAGRRGQPVRRRLLRLRLLSGERRQAEGGVDRRRRPDGRDGGERRVPAGPAAVHLLGSDRSWRRSPRWPGSSTSI